MADNNNELKKLKVFFQFGNGNVAIEYIDMNILSSAGILYYKKTYFVFAHFVHGENAVQFDQAQIAEISNG